MKQATHLGEPSARIFRRWRVRNRAFPARGMVCSGYCTVGMPAGLKRFLKKWRMVTDKPRAIS